MPIQFGSVQKIQYTLAQSQKSMRASLHNEADSDELRQEYDVTAKQKGDKLVFSLHHGDKTSGSLQVQGSATVALHGAKTALGMLGKKNTEQIKTHLKFGPGWNPEQQAAFRQELTHDLFLLRNHYEEHLEAGIRTGFLKTRFPDGPGELNTEAGDKITYSKDDNTLTFQIADSKRKDAPRIVLNLATGKVDLAKTKSGTDISKRVAITILDAFIKDLKETEPPPKLEMPLAPEDKPEIKKPQSETGPAKAKRTQETITPPAIDPMGPGQIRLQDGRVLTFSLPGEEKAESAAAAPSTPSTQVQPSAVSAPQAPASTSRTSDTEEEVLMDVVAHIAQVRLQMGDDEMIRETSDAILDWYQARSQRERPPEHIEVLYSDLQNMVKIRQFNELLETELGEPGEPETVTTIEYAGDTDLQQTDDLRQTEVADDPDAMPLDLMPEPQAVQAEEEAPVAAADEQPQDEEPQIEEQAVRAQALPEPQAPSAAAPEAQAPVESPEPQATVQAPKAQAPAAQAPVAQQPTTVQKHVPRTSEEEEEALTNAIKALVQIREMYSFEPSITDPADAILEWYNEDRAEREQPPRHVQIIYNALYRNYTRLEEAGGVVAPPRPEVPHAAPKPVVPASDEEEEALDKAIDRLVDVRQEYAHDPVIFQNSTAILEWYVKRSNRERPPSHIELLYDKVYRQYNNLNGKA